MQMAFWTCSWAKTLSNFANLTNTHLANNKKHKRLLFGLYNLEAGRMTDHSDHEGCKLKQLVILLRVFAYRI